MPEEYIELADISDIDADAQARLGRLVSQFMRSTPGQYVEARAEDAKNRCLEELLNADPEDAKEIARIQRELKAPILAVKWLDEIIAVAENAEAQQREPTSAY